MMVKDISSGQMVMNIAENSRITRNGERQYSKKTDIYSEINTKQIIASAGVKYQKILDVE
jgi:hypothetical protein